MCQKARIFGPRAVNPATYFKTEKEGKKGLTANPNLQKGEGARQRKR